MNRQHKEAVVTELKDMFAKANASFLVEYKGVSVTQLQSLRRQLREQRGFLKITKARLMKRATEDMEAIDGFRQNFREQIGLVFALDEAPGVAKKIVDFSKENESLKVVAGFFESQVMSKEEVIALASIPSREVLLAQLVGVLQAPLSQFAACINQLKEKKEKEEGSLEGASASTE
jgi:large subunit ribosomal protein L10